MTARPTGRPGEVRADARIDELLARRVLVVVGKGGVGRTTVAAALALLAASRGGRVLAIEYDPRAPLAALFNVEPGLVEPVELSPNVFGLALIGSRQLEKYLGLVVPSRALLRAVTASRLYNYFVEAAPGLRELISIGRIFHEVERRGPEQPPWDLIVVDAPASGQALSLLQMPFAARRTFGLSVVGREADNIGRLLRDPRRCAAVMVTTAEPVAIAETLETHDALNELGLAVAAIVLNRLSLARFGATDVAALISRARANPAVRHADLLCALARAELARAGLERRLGRLLGRRVGTPMIELPEIRPLAGLALAQRLADELRAAGGAQAGRSGVRV